MNTMNRVCEHERGDLNGNIHVCKKNEGHSGEHSAYVAKHTPGPWKVASPLIVIAYHGVGRLIVDCDKPMSGSMEENEANASLIAAAPELLEAAKRASAELSVNGHVDCGDCAICDANRELKAAIAKAEGR